MKKSLIAFIVLIVVIATTIAIYNHYSMGFTMFENDSYELDLKLPLNAKAENSIIVDYDEKNYFIKYGVNSKYEKISSDKGFIVKYTNIESNHPDSWVLIKNNTNIDYERLMETMDLLRDAGAANIGIIYNEPGKI